MNAAAMVLAALVLLPALALASGALSGRIFCVDAASPSPWSRFNVGALADPKVQAALVESLRWHGRTVGR